MDEAFRFNPSWIFDPAVWRIIEHADKNAAARLQIQLAREILGAQLKAVEGAAKIIGQG
jgi:hypothetical protein